MFFVLDKLGVRKGHHEQPRQAVAPSQQGTRRRRQGALLAPMGVVTPALHGSWDLQLVFVPPKVLRGVQVDKCGSSKGIQ